MIRFSVVGYYDFDCLYGYKPPEKSIDITIEEA